MANKNFNQRVYQIVKKIPPGRVASYGQIAALIGNPRSARAVGWALRASHGISIPWQRVVSSKGYLTITNPEFSPTNQKKLLEAENIKIKWDNNKQLYRLDLDQYLWHP